MILHLLFESFAARRDARVRFLRAQVTILRRQLGSNRVVLSPADRAEPLRIRSELRHEVKDVLGIVTAQTYRRWVRERNHGRVVRSVGRPRLGTNVRELVRRLTRENIAWGYRRILGELQKLYIPIGRSSVRRILHEEGVLPPGWTRRGLHVETPWRKFIRLHMNTLVACDSFTQDIPTPLGKKVAFCLFFLHPETRRVFLCPATYHPTERWMVQQARNVQMWLEDEGIEARFLLRDRDAKFARAFDQLFRDAGTKIVKTPVQGPDANAFAESFVSNARRECLNHFLCFSLRHLDHIAGTWVRYYNQWRPHQSLGNRTLPDAQSGAAPLAASPDVDVGAVHCQKFLGGLLRHYYRVAAQHRCTTRAILALALAKGILRRAVASELETRYHVPLRRQAACRTYSRRAAAAVSRVDHAGLHSSAIEQGAAQHFGPGFRTCAPRRYRAEGIRRILP